MAANRDTLLSQIHQKDKLKAIQKSQYQHDRGLTQK